MDNTLFDLPSPEARPQPPEVTAEPRLQRPNREQVELRPVDLESLLPADHRARVVWEFVEGLDLEPLHAEIKAVEGHAGRPAIDPAILMALWLYATVEGVGSARAIARLCEEHDAYRWLCGGVSVNYHTLADFRVQHVEYLDRVLTTSVATLMAEGLVTLTRVAQDGVRVRASAGAAALLGRARLRFGAGGGWSPCWRKGRRRWRRCAGSCRTVRGRRRGGRRRRSSGRRRRAGSGWRKSRSTCPTSRQRKRRARG